MPGLAGSEDIGAPSFEFPARRFIAVKTALQATRILSQLRPRFVKSAFAKDERIVRDRNAALRAALRNSGLMASESLFENRPKRRGQEHFAPKAPQTVPDPDGSRIGSKEFDSTTRQNLRFAIAAIGNFCDSPARRFRNG